jgi:hypothetical protein
MTLFPGSERREKQGQPQIPSLRYGMTNKKTDNSNSNSDGYGKGIANPGVMPRRGLAYSRIGGRFMGWGLEATDEEFALVDHLGGEMVVEGEEELFVAHDLLLPLGSVDSLELVEGLP